MPYAGACLDSSSERFLMYFQFNCKTAIIFIFLFTQINHGESSLLQEDQPADLIFSAPSLIDRLADQSLFY